MGKPWKQWETLLSWAWNIKKQRHYFADKGPSSQSYGYSSSHVWMWELDHKKADHWRINAFELWCWRRLLVSWSQLESSLDCKEIKPVNPKGNQSWIFIGRTDAEAETPIPWPPDANNWLIWKDTDAGKDWRQEEKGTTEDEMVGWTRVWASSRSWWWTGKPGLLQSIGSQRVGHNWVTELNW